MSREQHVVPLLFPVGLEAADVLLFKRLFVTLRAQSLQVDQPALHFFKLPLQKGWEHTHAHNFTYIYIHTRKVLYIMVTRTNRKRKNKKKTTYLCWLWLHKVHWERTAAPAAVAAAASVLFVFSPTGPKAWLCPRLPPAHQIQGQQ